MNATRTDSIMLSYGFQPEDTGPFVQQMRREIRTQVANGLYSAHALWAGNGTPEQRARAWLEVEWEVRHGGAYRVKAMGGLIGRSFNIETGERRYRIKWAWFGDRLRQARARARRVWAGRNPYRGRIEQAVLDAKP